MLVKKGRRRSRHNLATIVGCGIVAVAISNLRLGLTLPVFDIGSLGINNPPAATGGDRLSQGGSYRRSDGNVTVYRRYHELASEVQEAVRQSPWRNNNPSRADATVVREATPWFVPRRACCERCCVSTVAVSMSHESRKIINTIDGNDLADVRLQQYKLHPHLNQGVGALYFREEMIPCLVPGTIFDVDNHKSILNYFMYEIRPKMRHPYAMITAESDAYSPLVLPLFEKDELLLKWHGTNPRRDKLNKHADKFRPMGLGLSSKHQQERHLLPFLRLNNFTNPFEGRKERYDVTKHPLDFDEDVFVHFGNRDRQPRKRLWEVLCNETSPDRVQDVSCNDSGKFSGNRDPHALYADASRRRFGLSPPGHGWDCYRTYELLLLGVIPIVDGSPPLSRELFEGLPVVFIQNMAETIRSQKDVLDAVARYVESDEFRNARPEDFGRGWERLFLRYRRRLLLRDAGRERDILVDDNGIEYYQAFHYTVVGDGGDNGNKAIYCSEKGNCESDEDASKLRWGIPNLTDSDRAFLMRWNNSQ